MGMAIGGGFLKTVIPGTVRRHAPADRQATGFSLFYASVNAGSVIGKVLTKIVREMVSLRAAMLNAIVACAIGLAVALGAYHEPAAVAPPKPATDEPPPRPTTALGDLLAVLAKGELVA